MTGYALNPPAGQFDPLIRGYRGLRMVFRSADWISDADRMAGDELSAAARTVIRPWI
jgi:hypothetical protein